MRKTYNKEGRSFKKLSPIEREAFKADCSGITRLSTRRLTEKYNLRSRIEVYHLQCLLGLRIVTKAVEAAKAARPPEESTNTEPIGIRARVDDAMSKAASSRVSLARGIGMTSHEFDAERFARSFRQAPKSARQAMLNKLCKHHLELFDRLHPKGK